MYIVLAQVLSIVILCVNYMMEQLIIHNFNYIIRCYIKIKSSFMNVSKTFKNYNEDISSQKGRNYVCRTKHKDFNLILSNCEYK